MSLLTIDKNTDSFCILDNFCKEFSKETAKNPHLPENGRKQRNRPCDMFESKIMAILMRYHFGTFDSFNHFYLHYIGVHPRIEFFKQLYYSRFFYNLNIAFPYP